MIKSEEEMETQKIQTNPQKLNQIQILLQYRICTLYITSIVYLFFQEWKREKEEEMKAKLAESARYKSFRRYMKKGGPGQMSFGPE